jgi:hypothetical protein
MIRNENLFQLAIPGRDVHGIVFRPTRGFLHVHIFFSYLYNMTYDVGSIKLKMSFVVKIRDFHFDFILMGLIVDSLRW